MGCFTFLYVLKFFIDCETWAETEVGSVYAWKWVAFFLPGCVRGGVNWVVSRAWFGFCCCCDHLSVQTPLVWPCSQVGNGFPTFLLHPQLADLGGEAISRLHLSLGQALCSWAGRDFCSGPSPGVGAGSWLRPRTASCPPLHIRVFLPATLTGFSPVFWGLQVFAALSPVACGLC